MKRAQGKLPHIRWNPDTNCLEGYVFKGASRPAHLVSGFKRGFAIISKKLKQRHEAMVKRRQDQEAARQWYDFKAKHDID